MPININVTATVAGLETGPFEIRETNSSGTVVATGLSRTQLLSGVNVNVSNGTTQVYVGVISGPCAGTNKTAVINLAPTPTPTVAPTTPTPTAVPTTPTPTSAPTTPTPTSVPTTPTPTTPTPTVAPTTPTPTTPTPTAPTINYYYLKYCSNDADVFCGGVRQTLSDNQSTWSIGNSFYNTCVSACTYLSVTAPQGSVSGNIDGSTVTRYNSCASCVAPTPTPTTPAPTTPTPTTPTPTAAPLNVSIYVSNGSWDYNTGGDQNFNDACSAATSGIYQYSVQMYKAPGNSNFYPEIGDTFVYNGNTVIGGAYYGWSGPGPSGLDVYWFGLNGPGSVATGLTVC